MRHLPISILAIGLLTATSLTLAAESAAKHWHQAAGPNGNWQVEGTPPTEWSVTRNENIRWRTPMPEAGMSNATVWGDRVFVTTHVPIKTLEEKEGVKDIIGFCLDANTGKILWQVNLPGTAFISLAGGFTDGTVFAPITDGEHVWFFNRCGAMGCYDFAGKQVWLREWTPRFKHNNRQAEPYLVGDVLLNVEVANKEQGAKMRKWDSPGVISKNGTAVLRYYDLGGQLRRKLLLIPGIHQLALQLEYFLRRRLSICLQYLDVLPGLGQLRLGLPDLHLIRTPIELK